MNNIITYFHHSTYDTFVNDTLCGTFYKNVMDFTHIILFFSLKSHIIIILIRPDRFAPTITYLPMYE